MTTSSTQSLAGGSAARPSATWRDGARRRRPRIWDTDWLVLRGMQSVIGDTARRVCVDGSVALDFGCGDRPYEPVFRDLGVAYRGADFAPGSEVAITADGCIAAPDGCTDLLLSFQVLEHVRDLDRYLGEAKRVLKPDGKLLLSTHGTWLYHPHPEDHRRWTRTGLLADLASRGFETMECTAIVGPLAWTTLVRLTCAAVALRRLPLVGHALAASLAVVMNARAWLEDAISPKWVTDDNACVYVTLSQIAAERRR